MKKKLSTILMILSLTFASHMTLATSESAESSIESNSELNSELKKELRPHRKHGPRMELTSEQKTCLESKIGKPEVTERPSREDMEAAFKACEIMPPKRHN